MRVPSEPGCRIAAIILREGRLLLTRKAGTAVFLSPGGRPLPGESDIEALRRELQEETGLLLLSARPFGVFSARSELEDEPMVIRVYETHCAGQPRADSEIEEVLWVDADGVDEVRIGSVFRDHVIPKLRQEGWLQRRQPAHRPPSERADCVVFDIDGTVCFDDRSISPRILSTVERLIDRGTRVFFATSRAPRGLAYLLPVGLRYHGAICCNGALVVRGDTVLSRHPLPDPMFSELLRFLIAAHVNFYLDYGNTFTVHGSPSAFSHLRRYPPQDEPDRDALPIKMSVENNPAVKVGIYTRLYGGESPLSIHEHGRYIDLYAEGVNKHTALLSALDGNMPSGLTVFGNDYNDFELIAHASTSIVIGNKLDSLRHGVNAHFLPENPEVVVEFIDNYFRHAQSARDSS